MKLLNIFKSFKNDESGAVTVDWVVLTAAIVGLGMVVMTTVGGGIEGLGTAIVSDLEGRAAGYENQYSDLTFRSKGLRSNPDAALNLLRGPALPNITGNSLFPTRPDLHRISPTSPQT